MDQKEDEAGFWLRASPSGFSLSPVVTILMGRDTCNMEQLNNTWALEQWNYGDPPHF